jgi:hypothetical protein
VAAALERKTGKTSGTWQKNFLCAAAKPSWG